MYLSHLSLSNFRNYPRLELQLSPGLNLFWGDNGQGKTNLLEAIYTLAISKSYRTNTERELIRWDTPPEEICRITATVQRQEDSLQVEILLRNLPQGATYHYPEAQELTTTQKYLRVNGLPCRALELVGQLNAVLFSTQDVDLIQGSPSSRRRYLDILLSQLDSRYLRTLQQYQKVLAHRNRLLKLLAQGGAHRGELPFWDEELAHNGAILISQRQQTVAALSTLARLHHQNLADEAHLEIRYRPSVPLAQPATLQEIQGALHNALQELRRKEEALGISLAGPHRDDLAVEVNGVDMATFASRGQARTIALALKLAEAQHLKDQRKEEPVLLLDDVFSELDPHRRQRLLQEATTFLQVLITTADPQVLHPMPSSPHALFQIANGTILPV